RMTRRARQPRLRFGRLDLFLDRTIEAAVEEDSVIVAPRAPLRRLSTDDVLHVLDGLAIPLVVERRKMMGRRAPLFVDVAMTPPARLAGQEEVGGDDASNVRIGRRWKEWARRPSSLFIHADGHDR